MMDMTPVLVCLCGGVGAAMRYICDSYIKAFWHKAFPMSTFVINVVAGFLAGLVAGPRRDAVAVGHGVPRRLLHVLDHDERDGRFAAQGQVRLLRRIPRGIRHRAGRRRRLRLSGGMTIRRRRAASRGVPLERHGMGWSS